MPVFYTNIPASLKCILQSGISRLHALLWTDVEFPLLRNTVTLNQICITSSAIATSNILNQLLLNRKERRKKKKREALLMALLVKMRIKLDLELPGSRSHCKTHQLLMASQ